MQANERQVGGVHYRAAQQHWDRVVDLGLDYFQAQVTKYVERCWRKDGIQDLEKARHFLDKYIEVKTAEKSVAESLRSAAAKICANPVGLRRGKSGRKVRKSR